MRSMSGSEKERKYLIRNKEVHMNIYIYIFSQGLPEKSDIWTWLIFKVQLPVTCGTQQGLLNRDRLAKGQ